VLSVSAWGDEVVPQGPEGVVVVLRYADGGNAVVDGGFGFFVVFGHGSCLLFWFVGRLSIACRVWRVHILRGGFSGLFSFFPLIFPSVSIYNRGHAGALRPQGGFA